MSAQTKGFMLGVAVGIGLHYAYTQSMAARS